MLHGKLLLDKVHHLNYEKKNRNDQVIRLVFTNQPKS